MKSSKFLFVLGAIFVLLVAGLGNQPVFAGRSQIWSPDEKVPGYLDDTFTPFVLADRNRTIHAFASQWVENKGRRRAIVYRQWTLRGGWTRPVDIILSPTDGDANFVWAYLDSSDVFHVIFTATQARRTAVYYSSAPAANADWAPAWSPPMLVGSDALGLNSGAIIGDERGNLVIIYSGNRDGSGIYSMYSEDSGKTWSLPSPIFLTYDTTLSAFSLRLARGSERRVSAAWNVVTNLGVDEALYFGSFDLGELKWSAPVELERRIDLPDYFGPSFPALVDNGREIVIVYNSANPFSGRPVNAGRPIQRVLISTNGGASWNEPLDPFPFHVGRSGEHTLVLDGNGNPHTLFVQRIESADENGNYSIIGGVWHSVFSNGAWTNPDRFVTTVPAHDVRAAVAQGNVLLAVWRQDPGLGSNGVWYSYLTLDVPELPVTPLASVAAPEHVSLFPTAFPELNTPEPSIPPNLLDDAPPSNLGGNPALPIIIGTVPVALILIGVILGYRFLANRREQDE
ncbi:MAG: glycoside hydrolase [Anaerolineales bacterium]|nr:glycoside hydrolase [Anaerolineales bacterium]NUQ83823.1 exo-alpha-sialidase [Anaerolineales bacterium]